MTNLLPSTSTMVPKASRQYPNILLCFGFTHLYKAENYIEVTRPKPEEIPVEYSFFDLIFHRDLTGSEEWEEANSSDLENWEEARKDALNALDVHGVAENNYFFLPFDLSEGTVSLETKLSYLNALSTVMKESNSLLLANGVNTECEKSSKQIIQEWKTYFHDILSPLPKVISTFPVYVSLAGSAFNFVRHHQMLTVSFLVSCASGIVLVTVTAD